MDKEIIRTMRRNGKKLLEISEVTGVSVAYISRICRDIVVAKPPRLPGDQPARRRRRQRMAADYQANQEAMPDLPGEQWVPIHTPAKCEQYLISDHGRVRHATTRRVLALMTNTIGRKWVNLSTVRVVYIKALVIDHWLPPSPGDGMVVGFRNQDVTDCRAENLYYTTNSEIGLLGYQSGLRIVKPPKILNVERRAKIQAAFLAGKSKRKLTSMFNCSRKCVRTAIAALVKSQVAS